MNPNPIKKGKRCPFFKYCLKCGGKFKPIGKYEKLCVNCKSSAQTSIFYRKLEKTPTNPLSVENKGIPELNCDEKKDNEK